MPKQLHAYGIIMRPLITEKAQTMAASQNKYAFEVDKRANKMQIKQAVEQVFEVTVESVRVMNVAAHRRRNPRSRAMGKKAKQVVRKAGWKKAIIKLAEGQRLDLFEGV